MASISLCMIVRDEEAVLGRCLESVAPAVDEIIVVDTGSMDGTKAVAAAYTDRIFDFAWVDDFAAARNASFAKATGDYILWLDADDVLLPEDLDALPREWFHFGHLCDAQGEIPTDRAEMIRILREERLYVGEGGIDIAGILRHLPVPVLSIELPHLARAKEFGFAEHAARCLESAKKYMKESFEQPQKCFAIA